MIFPISHICANQLISSCPMKRVSLKKLNHAYISWNDISKHEHMLLYQPRHQILTGWRIYEFQKCQNNNATILHFQEPQNTQSMLRIYSTSIRLIQGARAFQSMDSQRDRGTRTSVGPRVFAKQQANTDKGRTSAFAHLGLKDSPNYGEGEMERYSEQRNLYHPTQ